MPSWEIVEPQDIRKIFKKLGQDEKNQYKSAIRTLATSDNPKNHAEYKKWLKCYSYDITKNFRILFDFDDKTKVIQILGIGDHKGSFGRDKKS